MAWFRSFGKSKINGLGIVKLPRLRLSWPGKIFGGKASQWSKKFHSPQKKKKLDRSENFEAKKFNMKWKRREARRFPGLELRRKRWRIFSVTFDLKSLTPSRRTVGHARTSLTFLWARRWRRRSRSQLRPRPWLWSQKIEDGGPRKKIGPRHESLRIFFLQPFQLFAFLSLFFSPSKNESKSWVVFFFPYRLRTWKPC